MLLELWRYSDATSMDALDSSHLLLGFVHDHFGFGYCW